LWPQLPSCGPLRSPLQTLQTQVRSQKLAQGNKQKRELTCFLCRSSHFLAEYKAASPPKNWFQGLGEGSMQTHEIMHDESWITEEVERSVTCIRQDCSSEQ